MFVFKCCMDVKSQTTYFCLHFGDCCIQVFLTVLQHFDDSIFAVCWLRERRDKALKDWSLDDISGEDFNKVSRNNKGDEKLPVQRTEYKRLTDAAASSSSLKSSFCGPFATLSAVCGVSSLN